MRGSMRGSRTPLQRLSISLKLRKQASIGRVAVAALLLLAITVIALRWPAADSPVGVAVTSQGPSTIAVAAAAPLTLAKGGKSVVVAGVDSCGSLALSDFYREFCELVATPSWASIKLPEGEGGPTPAMLARLVRAGIDNDPSVCSDPATLQYMHLGSRTPMTDKEAIGICEASIARFRTEGTSIFDYSSTDNADPLRVTVP